jgi:hypothetical protein
MRLTEFETAIGFNQKTKIRTKTKKA